MAAEHAELAELQFHGDRAVAAIAPKMSELGLDRALPLVIVLERIGTPAALSVLARQVADLTDNAFSVSEQVLLATFDETYRRQRETRDEAHRRIRAEARTLI